MKLTKKMKAEILQVYDTWLNAYLNGDLKTYDYYFDDDYHFIGSTNNEEFLSRKDTTKFFKKTADQLAGKTELKNKIKTIEFFDGLVFVTEFFDAYFLITNEWTYYGRFRFTSVMRQNKEGWRFIYQHFSMPDSKAQEGETLGSEKISKENQELRDAIRRRTAELEQKNRQLEIEAALERVRARTMAMQHSDELQEASFLLDQQVKGLGIKTWGCAFNIYGEKESTEWFGNEAGVLPTYKVPRAGIFKEYYQKGQKGESLLIKEFSDEACVAHYEYMSSLPVIGEVLKNLKKANKGFPTFQIDHVVYFKYGYLLFITREHVPEAHDIFKRFAQVFEQTYTRFLDLQKAELQAREAQIETALERVRSKSLAMYHTYELQEVIFTVHQELLHLKVSIIGGSFIVINNEIENELHCWGSGGTAETSEEIHIPFYKKPFYINLINRIKKGPGFFTEEFTQKEKKEFFTFLFKHEPWSNLNAKQKKETLSSPGGYTRSCIVSQHTSIFIINHLGEKFSAAENHILKRFGKVFEQSYTRFLDLQKAEAQAREAEIELALERVRARTMAMHKGEELADTALLLFKQISDFGIKQRSCGFLIMDEETGSMKDWSAHLDENGNASLVTGILAFNQHPMISEVVATWQKGEPYFIGEIHGKDLQKYYKAVTSQETTSKAIQNKVLAVLKSEFTNSFNFEYGMMYVLTPEAISEREISIMLRFAKVFKQTYTRFLDLQKAEAQARESEIELALERVRARAMAMQRSDELNDVLSVLFQQIELLGIDAKCAHLTLMDVENNQFSFRITGKNGAKNIGEQIIDLNAMDAWKETVAKWKKSKPHSHQCLVYLPEVLPGLWELINASLQSLPAKERIRIKDYPDGVFDCEGHTKFGYIGFNNSRPPTEEEINIVVKFAREFERVYQRFLDIQKAEVQAREAQIETSLERIRSKSMAMQKPDDLNDVLSLLFQQFDILQIKPVNVWLSLLDLKKETFTYRATGTGGARLHTNQVIDFYAMDIWQEALKQWKTDTPDSVLLTHYPNDIWPQLIEVFSETFMAMPEDERLKREDFPNGLYNVQGYTKFGYLGFNHFREPTDEEKDILRKFAKEFERVYQRFLDIQKAEAQARESEIQLALERVRAKSLAMKNSDELHQVLSVLFRQFDNLGIKPVNVFLSLFDRENRTLTYRASGKSGTRIPGKQVVKVDSMEPLKALYDKWLTDNSDSVEVIHYPKEVLPQLFGIFAETFASMPEEDRMGPEDFPDGGYSMAGYTPFGYLGYDHQRQATEEEKDILSRFCIEFTRVYQRFLDIQKAEAQAREAQIEMALERVRSRSLAMHHSSEVNEVVAIVSDQLADLGFQLDACHIYTFEDLPEGHYGFLAVPYSKSAHKVFFPYGGGLEQIVLARKNNKLIANLSFDFDFKNQFFQHFFEQTNLKVPQERQQLIYNAEGMTVSVGLSKITGIAVLRYTMEPFSKEELEILQRFSYVFEQAYTRFLDLQKAEAQAREAQIEAALEKVRSRSLAMHNADELQEVVTVVGEKLQELGVILDSGGVVICTYFSDNQDVKHWTATFDSSFPSVPYYLPYFDTPIWNETLASKNSGTDFFEKNYSFEDKNHFFHYAFEHSDYKNLPAEYKQALLDAESHALSFAWAKNSALMIASHTGMLLPDEHKIILKRFAKVFEQAYIRFMDLQKAEAQAREAQIETSLEKVRSRSLAMHNSKELQQVVNVVYDQLKELGLQSHAVAMSGVIKPQSAYEVWVGGSTFSEPLVIPYTDSTQVQREYNQVIESRPELFCKTYSGEIMKEYFEFLIKGNEFPDEIEKLMLECEAFSTTLTFAKNSGMQLVRYSAEPYTDAENKLLIRFQNVFEQAYVRFMDLQKAEAQAREAQIEMALERVRARSMGMHQTDELSDVLCVLFEQFDFLGINPVLTHLTLMDEVNETFTLRITTSPKERVFAEQKIDINAVESWKASFENWKKGAPNTVDCIDYPPEVLPYVWEVMNEVMNALPKGHKINPKDFPNGLFTTQGRFKFGYLGFNHSRRATDEEKNIVSRFATEFGRVYQRFLDLQKAEAQSREAMIEASLERIRAKAMAMQHTEELNEVIGLLCEQYDILGINPVCAHLSLIDVENNRFSLRLTGKKGTRNVGEQIIDANAMPVWAEAVEKWRKSEPLSHQCLVYPPEQVPLVMSILDGVISTMTEEARVSAADFPNGLFSCEGQNKFGNLGFNHSRPPTEEEIQIVVRFAREFERIYQRFLDLEKAEAQAREAQVEAALEKVRSRSMGMQKSDELKEVIRVVYEQFVHLKINVDHAGFIVDYEPMGDWHFWIADEQDIPAKITHPYFESVWAKQFNKAKEHDVNFFVTNLNFEEKNIFYNELLTYIPELTEASKDFYLSCPGLSISTALFDNVSLYIENFSGIPYSDEENKILMRFGKVFQQTYTRFLDLQKAEAQAKEALIESALERVRSRSMAMHKSEELSETAEVLFEQIDLLGKIPDRISIATINEENNNVELWVTDQGGNQLSHVFLFSLDEPTTVAKIYNAWKKKKDHVIVDLTGKDLQNWLQFVKQNAKLPIDETNIKGRRVQHAAFFSQGFLLLTSHEPVTNDIMDLLVRFAKVFDQTYRRFLDLQKAEAQAREAQIEAALERVRSKTMAMHNSQDVGVTVVTLFDEVLNLDLDKSIRCGIGILEGSDLMETWSITSSPNGEVDLKVGMLDMRAHPMLVKIKKSWKSGNKHYKDQISGKEVFKYYKALNDDPGYPFNANLNSLPKKEFHNSFSFPEGIIFSFSPNPMSEEATKVFGRFAHVFGQTYRRYLDLQKAEAQAKEAQIENALEKVRSRTMAMQHSKELPEAANNLFLQVQELGIPAWSAGYCIWNENKESANCNMSSEGQIQKGFSLPSIGVGYNFYDPYKNGDAFHVAELGGQELVAHYQFMRTLPTVGEILDELISAGLALPTFQIFHIVYFTYGYVMFITYESVPEAHDVFKRFGKVFEQTYTRFLDLQKAEAQARESQIETGLERVRSRTLAMQKSDELAETSVVVFKELINIGIEPNRLFIGIINDETQNIEAWATNEDGTKIGNHFTLNTQRNASVKKMYEGWKKKKKSITIDMTGKELKNYFHYLADELEIPFKAGLTQKRRVQTIAYFGQGLIGMASPEEQPEETTLLLERFAAVFNLTYTRFNDLKIAEAHALQAEQDLIAIKEAKQNAEGALAELQSTQKQLIQSEKMASLGELTAGIAHEIQNPLNFVNNFSEVSKELLDEMKDELDHGNLEDAMELMQDIIQNLEKINHHGKRADAIVKGMLQHSRSSTGTKEPTDINALADEYLRLAYHGLRAKDKSFNASMKTDFDENIGRVHVIPQDIGRVILNLITNAFYVVDEKKKSGIANYEPTVSVSTKSTNGNIEISVTDNGNGIPKKVLDKIFQPFFTTKPTGQGTGLGLSMSYDIVTKGHGGELKVSTKEGVGTEFIVVLPLDKRTTV